MKTKDKANSATKQKKAKLAETFAKNANESKIVLGPCPHCGRKPCIWTYGVPMRYVIGCLCGGNATTAGHATLAEAVAQWNDWIAPEKEGDAK